MAVVGADTHQTLRSVSVGDGSIIEQAMGLRELNHEGSGLDGRTFSLVKIAALIALDEGASPEDILGVLRAVAPQVGGPRVVAAAPEIMVALGLSLDEEE